MPDTDPVLDELFIARFNADLAQRNCAATIAPPQFNEHRDVVELRDDEGQFVCFLPASATPEVTVVAYRLYGQGLNKGLRAGEDLAWSKLRWLIGAAPSDGRG